ncbi:MAG TPA: hypothetical protein PKD91_08650 [Bacteroidia bacterium]|nr:hypothetical protein [Bacteroidia bacterium]
MREFKALGFFYSLILSVGIIGLFSFYFQTQVSSKNVLIGALVILFLIATLHFSRTDHQFIKLVAQNPPLVYLTEYGVCMFPFFILSWIQYGQPIILFSIFPLLLISFWNVRQKSMDPASGLGKFIPAKNYEWKAGLRQSGWLFVLLWAGALILVFVPFASLILLWFILLIISSFYDQGESQQMIESFELNQTRFLLNKIKIQLITFLIPAIPVLLLCLVFFPERWWVFILFMVFSVLNISVFVVSKYAVWRHGEINKSNSVVNGLCMVGFFLPFLLPLPVFVFVKNFRKSVINLKPLLNDYN